MYDLFRLGRDLLKARHYFFFEFQHRTFVGGKQIQFVGIAIAVHHGDTAHNIGENGMQYALVIQAT